MVQQSLQQASLALTVRSPPPAIKIYTAMSVQDIAVVCLSCEKKKRKPSITYPTPIAPSFSVALLPAGIVTCDSMHGVNVPGGGSTPTPLPSYHGSAEVTIVCGSVGATTWDSTPTQPPRPPPALLPRASTAGRRRKFVACLRRCERPSPAPLQRPSTAEGHLRPREAQARHRRLLTSVD